MTQPQAWDIPHLVVLAPPGQRGRRIDLRNDYTVVGRAETCDVRFNDPDVSRAHAALQRQGGAVYLQDLGSTAGTLVNGVPATGRHFLNPGDIITLATVQLRFSPDRAALDETRVGPRQTGGHALGAQVRYDIDQQVAGAINNVGGDQHNSYVQHIVQQRDDFLRAVAATKTKARWLVWIGFLFFVVGFALFASGAIGFLNQISSDIQSDNPTPPTDPFGAKIGGIPSGLLGWALSAVGILVLIIGIVLHIVAAARRKRVDRDYPMPAAWPQYRQGMV
jgi:uncharacterized membrane protein